ncbi:alpha/beta-hydrolase family protein [Streptomyces sp. DSM 44917]|uniref:Alpha/beta-hydrolase family protein n=1 Tax=Streptomyces boetiae TaxID=3075541 RepID=A0ABU2LG97_9ACTN|nr:alpha/beta-hydrolase family protein [Streptomyces sp. DSM 44917]MDT0310572.1 alpha/beta-hydrolase family protein [Streptomyces sp. DSM 44917]
MTVPGAETAPRAEAPAADGAAGPGVPAAEAAGAGHSTAADAPGADAPGAEADDAEADSGARRAVRAVGAVALRFARQPYWERAGADWVVRRWPDLTACLVATFFFWLSLTPSLVPRPWYYQGVIGGITAAIGYGLGALLSRLFRLVSPWQPSQRARARCWLVYLLALPWAVGIMLGQSADMQRELRRLQELPPTLTWHSLMITAISLAVLALLLVTARAIRLGTRLLTRLLNRFVPWPVAVALGMALSTTLVVVGTRDVVWDRGVLEVADRLAAAKDRSTDPGVLRPYSPALSGSPDSLIAWEDLGNKGRTFTGTAISGEEISGFTGEPARDPIRAYVGRAAYEDYADGAELAVRELERTGAFEREVLAVTGTTGTGWVNPTTVEALEYLHGGDTAVVAMQYSYLPSWASFMVDRNEAGEATEALFDAVYARWQQEPEGERPRLLVFGESLAVSAIESAFDGLDDMIERTDGALMIGPPDFSPIHAELTRERDAGSPVWRPVYDGGRHVRFAQYPERDLRLPEGAAWEDPRIVYLQNASDPVVWWSPDLLFRRPEWLNQPLGPDVTSAIDWFPFVTFWQTTVDMAVSYGAPAPHGHRYGSNPVDAWAAVAPPEGGWTAEDSERLGWLLEVRHPPRHGWAG